MKKIIVMTLKLLVITVVAAIVLGAVYAVTKDPIAVQEAKAADEARFSAFSAAASFEKMDIDISQEYAIINNVYSAQDENGNDIGVVIGIITTGYSAGLNLTVGLSKDGVIIGVIMGANEETPGQGSKAGEPFFIDQYKNVPFDTPLILVKSSPANNSEIQAVTGATITSDSITHAVNKAVAYYTNVLGMGSTVTKEAIAEQEAKAVDEDKLSAFRLMQISILPCRNGVCNDYGGRSYYISQSAEFYIKVIGGENE